MTNRCVLAMIVGLAVLSSDPSAQGPSSTAPPPVDATMLQLMRGIIYPASNVVFAAQDDLSKQPKAEEESISPNPLTNAYGGWVAVENAAMALAEASRLLGVPGRLCGNGRPVPVERADWIKYTADLRAAGLAAYEAAKKKDTNVMIEVSGAVTDACSACHQVYRRDTRDGQKQRCQP